MIVGALPQHVRQHRLVAPGHDRLHLAAHCAQQDLAGKLRGLVSVDMGAGAITGGHRRVGDHRVIEVGVHLERDGDRGPEVDRTQPLRELPFAVFEALGDYGAIRHSGLSPSADHRLGCRLA